MLTREIDFVPGRSESGILSRVSTFARENALYRQNGFSLAEDDNFFQKGAGDSRYVAEMITFVEEEFGVHVSDCEISEDNLGSLRAVAHFVAGKQPYAVG